MPWERPTSVPFPSVWGHHVGKKALANGEFPKFRIQDAPVELFEEIVDHMCEIFLKGEPICVNAKFVDDKSSVEELRQTWREMLEQKMALVAFVDNDDGTSELASVNVTGISFIEDKDKEWKFEGAAMQKVLGCVDHMTHLADVFTLYGVTEYLTAMGLSVAPKYQGQGLGQEMLKARIPLCKATGLKLTATIFTAGNSQELARRTGFKILAEMKYVDYKKDGKEVFPGILTKLCKNMALAIE